MSEIGGRLGCARAGCGLPKLHSIHVGSGMEHEYKKPERKVRREAMAAHSVKQEEYYREVRRPAVEAIQGKPCEARVSDRIAVGPRYRCTGKATDIHELVRRSQAGSLEKAVEYGVLSVCRPCHQYISDHPAIAKALGFEISGKEVGIDYRDRH